MKDAIACQQAEDTGMRNYPCATRCFYAPDNAHVICCNDAVMHVHLGSEEQAEAKLEELAKADYEHSYRGNGDYGDNGFLRHLGATPYERYRRSLRWYIRTTGVSIK